MLDARYVEKISGRQKDKRLQTQGRPTHRQTDSQTDIPQTMCGLTDRQNGSQTYSRLYID